MKNSNLDKFIMPELQIKMIFLSQKNVSVEKGGTGQIIVQIGNER